MVLVQFLKSGHSGERAALSALPTVDLLPLPEQMKFVWTMTEEEKQTEALRQTGLLEEAFRRAQGADLLVLDELCAAVTTGLVPLPRVLSLLDSCPEGLEVVITGRDPDPALLDRADYVTEMKKLRHPFDQGKNARKGIEF